MVLATASERRLARLVSDHLGIFTGVIASELDFNCKGPDKLAAILKDSDGRGFEYVGDSSADLPIWRQARQAVIVSSEPRLLRRAKTVCPPAKVIEPQGSGLRDTIRALRPHQWVKNLLLFVPLITSHHMFEPAYLVPAILALLTLCMAASATYLLNDLLDLQSDRIHPNKRSRPLASGRVSIPQAFVMFALLMAGVVVAMLLQPWYFDALVLCYLILTTAYSLVLKRKLMADVICLAALYTLRIVAGGEATGIEISPWLMVFSMFFFLSLAFAKRYTELITFHDRKGKIPGRGYQPIDLEMIRTLGPASGYLCLLVMAQYIYSPEVQRLYSRPWILWLACCVLLYWISRIWFLAHRRQLPHDPVVFALRDRNSYVAGLMLVLILLAAI